MLFSSNPLFNTLKSYILIILLLIYFKPDFIYDKKRDKFRKFGINKNKTLFTFPVIAILLPILLYTIFLTIYNITNTNTNNNKNIGGQQFYQIPIQYIPYPIQHIPIQTNPIQIK